MSDPKRSDVLAGIVFLIISACFFGSVDGMSKVLADTQSVGQIIWTRYALALPMLLLITPPRQWRALFVTRSPGLQIVRGLTPLVISAGMVLGVRYLPLAEATVILFVGPFIVVALAGPLLGEHVRLSSWIAVAIGFLAVIVVARPGFSSLSKYTAFPLIAAVFFGFFQLFTRRLGMRGEKPTTTLAWTLFVGAVASTPLAIATWAPVSPKAWLEMLTLGVVFGLSQLFVARAPAAVLTPFSYVQIISAAIFGVVVFGDVPDHWTLLGIIMIIAAGAYLVRSQRPRPAEVAPVPDATPPI